MARIRNSPKHYEHWSRRAAPISSRRGRRHKERRRGSGRLLRSLLTVLLIIAVAVAAALPFRAEPRERLPFLAAQDVTVIAHAGGAGHAPDNTMEAFDTALEMGAHVLEMDLQLTSDNEVVLMHDETVDRTTDGSGRVRDMTLEEISELDAGYRWQDDHGTFAYRGAGLRVPTLGQILDRYRDVPLVIEMKTDSGDAIISAVADTVQAAGGRNDLIVASFDSEYLRRFRKKAPEVPTNLGRSEAASFYALQLLGLHRWYRPPGRVLQVPTRYSRIPVLVPGFTRRANAMGLDVQIWTINDYDEMVHVLDRGADAIITDYPDRALDAAAAFGRSDDPMSDD